MTKIERFEAIDRCLFWKEKKILIFGDLHLGYEEFLNEQGWVFPRTQLEETKKILSEILAKTGKLNKVIILGDVKHYFRGILSHEFSDFYDLIKILEKNFEADREIIIVKGNHDNILGPIINQKQLDFIKLKNFHKEEDILFFHGSLRDFEQLKVVIENKKIKLIVTGHFHPAVTIKEDEKQEKYKCFLLGRCKEFGKKWIIAPSFFPLVDGSDVLQKEKLKNKENLNNFKIFAIGDKVYDFGKFKNIKTC